MIAPFTNVAKERNNVALFLRSGKEFQVKGDQLNDLCVVYKTSPGGGTDIVFAATFFVVEAS